MRKYEDPILPTEGSHGVRFEGAKRLLVFISARASEKKGIGAPMKGLISIFDEAAALALSLQLAHVRALVFIHCTRLFQ